MARSTWIFSAVFISACSGGAHVQERNLGPQPLSSSSELKKVPETTPEEYVARGDKAFERGDYEKSIAEYVNALAGGNADLTILVKIATAHQRVGSNKVAESTFRQVLAERPDDVDALEGLGLALVQERRYPEARINLDRALTIDANRWRALNALGIISDLDLALETARTYYQRGLEIAPQSAELLNNLGYSYYLGGDLPEAEQYFLRALDNDPNHGKAWSNLGLLQVRQQRQREALVSFLKIMDKPHALNTVGYVCMLNRNLECAEQYFSQAVAASPQWYKEAADNLDKARSMRATLSPP